MKEVNGNAVNGNGVNGKGHLVPNGYWKSCPYEEETKENLRWSFPLKKRWSFVLDSIQHKGSTAHQRIALLDTEPFGKALVIDGKLRSAKTDEFIYHECLCHPALLHHPNPTNIFIMGGGEGSTARELLRHNTVENVVMCDIDEELVKFCKSNLDVNTVAFRNARLKLIFEDAGDELEQTEKHYDVIIGDLACPIEGGHGDKLYTKSFYELIVKPRLTKDGIFVTQAGPAGIVSHKEVFSRIYNTLKRVFKYVVPYSAHIPSYADTWGWIMASDNPFVLRAKELDDMIKQRIIGEIRYLDGETFSSASTLNKEVRKSIENETRVYTEGIAKFLKGRALPKKT